MTDWEKLQQLLFDQPELIDQLILIEDWGQFSIQVIRIGQQQGLDISTTEIQTTADQLLRAWLERWL